MSNLKELLNDKINTLGILFIYGDEPGGNISIVTNSSDITGVNSELSKLSNDISFIVFSEYQIQAKILETSSTVVKIYDKYKGGWLGGYEQFY